MRDESIALAGLCHFVNGFMKRADIFCIIVYNLLDAADVPVTLRCRPESGNGVEQSIQGALRRIE